MEVTSLDDHRPHVTIQVSNGDCHVIPVSVFQDVVRGRLRVSEIDCYEVIVQAIIRDWLADLNGREVQQLTHLINPKRKTT